MSVPDRRLATVPTDSTYRVDIQPETVYERLENDEEIEVVKRFPPRVRSKRPFLAMRSRSGFRLIQNISQTPLDGGPPEVRRFFLEVQIEDTAEGATLHASFKRGPQILQLRYLVLWSAAIAWLATTGYTLPKLGMVLTLLALTVPALIHDRIKARGTRDDRIALLSLMQHLLGSALIGQSPAEQTPYRDGHPKLPATSKPAPPIDTKPS